MTQPLPDELPEIKPKRRTWPFIVGGVLVIGLLGACVGDLETEPDEPEVAAETAKPTTEPIEKSNTAEATEEPEPEPTTEEPEPEPTTEEPEPELTTEVLEPTTEEPDPEPYAETDDEDEETEPGMPIGQHNAVQQAEAYLNYAAFSRTGLIEQLEYEGYSTEDATFAVDNIEVDWKEQAALQAESYLDFSSFSRQGLIDQLLFEGFTQEQAEHGVTAAGY